MTQDNNNSQNFNSQNLSSLDFTQENNGTGSSQLSQDMPGYGGNSDLSLNFGNDGNVELSQNSFDYFGNVGSSSKKDRKNQGDGSKLSQNGGQNGGQGGSGGQNSQNTQNFTGASQNAGNSMLSQDSNYGGNFEYQFSQN